jgi:hypothetical protein
MPQPAARIDPPLTPEEIADSRRIADDEMKLVRTALRGLAKPARRARRRERTGSGAALQERPDRLLPTLMLLLTPFCKRGECRRAGYCCYGRRRGDAAESTSEHGAAPCFRELPEVVQFVYPYAIMRQFYLERFRDESMLRFEKECVTFARHKIAEAAAVRAGVVAEPRDATPWLEKAPVLERRQPDRPAAPHPRLTQL